MAKRKPTDEEKKLAEDILAKLSEHPAFDGALKGDQTNMPVRPDPELRAQRADEIVHDNNDTVVHPPETVDAAGRTQARANRETADEQLASDATAHDDQAAARQILEGSVKGGEHTAEPKDAFGRTKDEADQELARKVLELSKPASADDKEGGTIGSRLRKAAGSLFSNAVPEGSGGGNDGSSDLMRGGKVGKPAYIDGAGGGNPGSGGGPGAGVPAQADNASHKPFMQKVDDLNTAITPSIQGALNKVGLDDKSLLDPNGANLDAVFPGGKPPSIGTVIGERLGPMTQEPVIEGATPAPQTSAPIDPAVNARAAYLGGGQRRIEAPAPEQDFSAQMQQYADQQQEALGHAARIAGEREHQIANVQAETEKVRADQQAKLQSKMEFVQAGQTQMMKNMTDAQAILNNPAKTPDPERYWKNHSKVMFAIGVGLLAQAGKDINGVLSNANQAIDRDVEEQKQEFEAPRNAARGKIAQAQSMYGMFRDMGHDAFESQRMAEAVLKDSVSTQIAKIAAASDSAIVKANAQAAQAQIGIETTKSAQAAAQHRAANDEARFGHQIAQENDIEKNRIDRAELNNKAAGQTDRALKPAEQKRLDAADELTNAVNEYQALLGPVEGPMSALDTSARANLPLVPTDAKDRRKALENARVRLSIAIGKNPRQNRMEMQRFLDSIPVNGIGNQNRKVFDDLLKAANDERESVRTGRPATSAQRPTRTVAGKTYVQNAQGTWDPQ